MIRRLLAVLFLTLPIAALAAPGFRLIYDSGTTCNAGAACASPVFPCKDLSEIAVLVNNRSGTQSRMMALWHYAADGVTPRGTVLLDRIPFGNAATGADGYTDPGGVTMLIGPAVTSSVNDKVTVLYDVTSAANTAQSADVDVSDCSTVMAQESPSAAAAASTITFYNLDYSSAIPVGSWTTTADAQGNHIAWGPGVSSAASGTYYKGGTAAPLPSRIRVSVGALGAGITSRLRVTCRGHVGIATFALPFTEMCKIAFDAAGAGTAAFYVYGRNRT